MTAPQVIDSLENISSRKYHYINYIYLFKTGQDKTKQNKVRQGKTRQNKKIVSIVQSNKNHIILASFILKRNNYKFDDN